MTDRNYNHCLDYARQGGWSADGVWKDVETVFSSKEMGRLYTDLEKVNEFRNTRVAHVEKGLDNTDEAWAAMVVWFRCLAKMDGLMAQSL